MQDLDAKAWELLEKKDLRHFYRLYFKTHAKYDLADTDMAKIFSGSIVEARYLCIASMPKEIFKVAMKRVT